MNKNQPTLETILKFSTAAADEAQRLAGCCPTKRNALNHFEKSIRQAQHELMRTLPPDTHSTSEDS